MQIAVVDIDADGDLDLVCPGKSGLFWLENLESASLSRVLSAALRQHHPLPASDRRAFWLILHPQTMSLAVPIGVPGSTPKR